MPYYPLDERPESDPRTAVSYPRGSETGANPLDFAIAEGALQALFQGTPLLRETSRIAVAGEQVALSGTVAPDRERSDAERIMSQLDSMVGVTNLVAVQPGEWSGPVFLGPAVVYGRAGESGAIPGRIEALFERDVEIGGTEIRITAQGGKAVLIGHVRSWRERDLAERVAWSAPGVTQVEHHLVVQGKASA